MISSAFSSQIARRFIFSRKSQRFVFVLALVSWIGIFTSVFSFILIHSVMNGFSQHMKRALVGFHSHLTVSDFPLELESKLSADKRVEHVQKIQEQDVILESAGGFMSGARVRGVDFKTLDQDQNLEVFLFDEEPDDHPALLVGEELYSRLQFVPGAGQIVTLIQPLGDVGPTGEPEPRRRDYRVSGVVKTGFFDFDARYVFMDSTEAIRLKGKDEPKLLVRLKDLNQVAPMAAEIQPSNPTIKIKTWETMNKRLFNALKLEKAGMILLLSLVMLVSCFNILALVSLLGVGRSRDIAVFRSLGLSKRKTVFIFLKVGWLLGISASLPAAGMAWTVLLWLKKNPLPLPPAYYLDHLPVLIDGSTVLAVLMMAPLFAVLASAFPAYQTKKLNPVEILRST